MYLGTYNIDDYVPIPAVTHRFSSGAAYAPTVLTYSIYEEGSATGLDENVDMTPASPFDTITGCYLSRRQLTAAAGFEVGKTYVVIVKATVDSVAAIEAHVFQVNAIPRSTAPLDSAGVGDAVLDEVVEGTETLRTLIRLIASVVMGNGVPGTGTMTYRDLANTKDRVVATVSGGARTVTSRDGS